jgi:excisionase family DNA binding protein
VNGRVRMSEARGRLLVMADPTPRFLPLADVAEILNISVAQVYALVRRGEIPAIKIGGRGQWRVEAEALEGYIQAAYSTTAQFIKEHPYVGDGTEEPVRPTEESVTPAD